MPYSYSCFFLIFWAVLLASCFGTQTLYVCNVRCVDKVENVLFWVFGFAMLAFALLRPFGIARDDFAYLEIYKSVCPTLVCGQLNQVSRDWGWYLLVGVGKSLLPTPRLLLGIVTIGLAFKLWVIFRLSRTPLVALLLFSGVFYQIQDLTAFRVSLSLTFLMLAIFVWIIRGTLSGSVVLCLPVIFHKQGFLSFFLLTAPLFKRSFWIVVIAMLMPCVALLVFGKPPILTLASFQNEFLQKALIKNGLEPYLYWQETRIIPISFYPLIGLGLWLAKDVFVSNRKLYCIVASSMALACGLMYIFAEITAAQVRFFEYFMLPIVLLAGGAQRNWFNLAMVASAAAVWVVRHNILHPLLL